VRTSTHVVLGTIALVVGGLLGGCVVKTKYVETCDLDPCSGHGTCAVVDDAAACTCDAGYVGETCTACDTGYHFAGDGTCAADQTCDPGYVGVDCTTCDTGYHYASDGTCVADQTCDPGYVGVDCTTCDTGYHYTSDGSCAADETCDAFDCGPNGSCQVTDGVAACTCDQGYASTGDACVPTCDDPDGDFWGTGPGCLGLDNCPAVANFDQADVDDDGIGDMCDVEALSHMVWSPDGSRIAFERCPAGQVEGCELWVSEADRSRAHLIHTGISAVFDWYGDAILFRADTGVGNPTSFDGTGELYGIAPDGTNLTRITFTYSNGTHCHCNSYWEPIGTVAWGAFVRGTDQVYFKANNGNGWWRAYLASADGSDGQTTFSAGYAWWTAASPIGDVLLYTTAPNYNQPMTIHAVTRGGGPDVVLAADLAPPVAMAVSPDGTKVAYVAAGASDRDVHVVGIDGTGDVAVISDTSQDMLDGYMNGTDLVWGISFQPWTADSQWLILSSDRAGLSHLFQVHPDGTNLTQISDGDYYQWAAAVSPDGTRISYHQLPSDYDPAAPAHQLVIEDF